VKKELQNLCPLSGDVVLEIRNVGEPLVPDALADESGRQLLPLQHLGMHPHDEDFFVVRTVKGADASALGQVSEVALHEVVIELLR
jgi:hypothetical protein